MIATLLVAVLAAGNPQLAAGLDEHVGAPIPHQLVFTDSTGHPRQLADLFDHRRPVLLVMAYARCTMLCSVVLHGISDAVRHARSVPGRDFVPVVVSLDPHETPFEGARRQDKLLADIHRPNDRAAWPYLVGDDETIHALARALGFRYAWDPKTEQYAHPVVVFVLTPDGRIAEYLRGVTFDGLDAALDRARGGTLSPSVAQDLLSCFHFDPALRRYEQRISLFFRLGAGVVLASLTAMIAALVIWERRRRT